MGLRIYGNRSLKTLPGDATRPTPARVREALFNIWQGSIEGCRWLDLCTGSGAMGAEALCRGATLVVGIEKSGRACGVIRHNWQSVAQPHQQFLVQRGDVIQQLRKLRGQAFDRIYFDPPYASSLYQPVLSAVASNHLLTLTGEIAVEHRPDLQPAIVQNTIETGLQCCRYKRYGNTAIAFYRLPATPDRGVML